MITLVFGGARSGKSEFAEGLAARAAGGGAVAFVATGTVTDSDMAARIEAHRARRPRNWETVEVGPGGDLAGALTGVEGVVLLDSLGTWLAGHEGFAVDVPALVAALAGRRAPTVVVSEEVGLGVHPSSEIGRRFRDALGEVNRAVATVAAEAYLVVAGRALRLDGEAPDA